jgi:hypothetical protein
LLQLDAGHDCEGVHVVETQVPDTQICPVPQSPHAITPPQPSDVEPHAQPGAPLLVEQALVGQDPVLVHVAVPQMFAPPPPQDAPAPQPPQSRVPPQPSGMVPQ